VSVCLHSQDSHNIKLRNNDLVVFIIDENDTATSVSILKKMISQRLRTNLEFWLIDISWTLASKTKSSIDSQSVEIMQDIHFDFNDDIFFYSHNYDTNITNVWEVYKIDPLGKLIITNHAKWSATNGLKFQQNVQKWRRRSDLQVKLNHLTLINYYLQKM
jgi:hypothetical protein